jgi:Dockerin type I domain/Protein of unknown function (DUF1565)
MTRISLAMVVGLAVCLVAAAPTSGATTVYVDASAAPGGSGTSGSPFQTIQQGINAAAAADTVMVAQGTYNEHIDFIGKSITVQSTDPAAQSVVDGTIVDGTSTGTVVTFAAGEGSGAVLNGLTIRNGQSTGTASSHGGGIDIQNASPQVLNCVVTGCHTATDGGGIAIVGNSSPLIQGNTIVLNTADGWGGGVFIFGDTSDPENIIDADPDLIRNRISTNTAEWDGGGVACFEACTVFIKSSVIDNNDSGQVGGGIFVGYGVTAIVENVTLADNIALGSDAADPGGPVTRVGRGGGMACWFSSPTYADSSILWGNSAKNDEGDQLSLEGNANVGVYYSYCEGGQAAVHVDPAATFTWGTLAQSGDPLFAPAVGDYHLQSFVGRYDPTADTWVMDAVSSPGIDAGRVSLAADLEPVPSGNRVNAGGYGNTPEASRSGWLFDVALVLDFDWTYQNTAVTTGDRHRVECYVTVTNDMNGNLWYLCEFEKTGGTGDVTVVSDPGDDQRYYFVGGRKGVGGMGQCDLKATVYGSFGGGNTATTSVIVRKLADVNYDSVVDTSDKLEINRALNGIPVPGLTPRDFDVNGDGVTDTSDKLLINQLLNGIAIP